LISCAGGASAAEAAEPYGAGGAARGERIRDGGRDLEGWCGSHREDACCVRRGHARRECGGGRGADAFAGEAHRSAWLAGLLTPLSRFMHEGNVPLLVLNANMPGSGKSTLAQLIAVLVNGSPVAVMACEKSEPNRKEIPV
jgi:hypothetical protein